MRQGPQFQCWRYPPTVVSLLTQAGSVLTAAPPTLGSADGCGEFAAATSPALASV